MCALALAEQEGLLVIPGEELVEARVLASLQHTPEQVACQPRAPEGDGPWRMPTIIQGVSHGKAHMADLLQDVFEAADMQLTSQKQASGRLQ